MAPFAALRVTILALSLPISLSPPPAHAQADYGRALTVTVEPGRVGLGDSVTLRFRLTINDRDLIADSVPRPVGDLPAGVRIFSVEKLRRGPDRAFTGSAVIAFYRPGKRALPAFGILWIQVVTGRRGVVTHDPAEIEVASVLPAGNPPLRDIREPDSPPGFGGLWALFAAAAAAAIAWLATRRRAKRPVPEPEPVAPPPPPPPPPDPYAAALVQLDAIEAECWAARGDVARHYEAVADALRDYLEEADGLPARERTTTELLWSLPPRLAEGGLRRRVQDVLGDADLVKFAKLRPRPDEAASYTTRARDLLERWHRAAQAGEELDALR
ncbi:MAG TPA: hypothetical protein VM094_00740 [Gemmatimonadales bacterium]|nr:hypothetical protein [Gemmatimonadales bacterium]